MPLGGATILALLDLSVGFGTITQGILLDRLWGLGVGGLVLQPFSFLGRWFQLVLLGTEVRPLVPSGLEPPSLPPFILIIYMKLVR